MSQEQVKFPGKLPVELSGELSQIPEEVVQELQRVTAASPDRKTKNPGRVAAGKKLAQRNKEMKAKLALVKVPGKVPGRLNLSGYLLQGEASGSPW